MPERDFQTLAALYVVTGVLWALWNGRSRFAHRVAERLKADRLAWCHAVGFVLAVLLWPLGLIGTAIFSRTGSSRRKSK